MIEKQADSFDKRREDDMKKNRIESKQKIIEDLQNKISNYKAELIKNRNRKDD
jgi:hypothetical protein